MAGDVSTSRARHAEALHGAGTAAGMTDGQLLRRFADGRGDPGASEAAFAAIVARHGPMVLRTCRRVLGDGHDAQDAAQAAFLVLARRAGAASALDSAGGWLHGVAARVAAKARVAAARRRRRERIGAGAASLRMAGAPAPEASDGPWAELHEELGRLPDTFRAPLVLCYFEGLTQEQAAAQLRCPLGTVQSRLARGRAKLRSRLTRRGVSPSAWLVAGDLVIEAAPALPDAWVDATSRAALSFITKPRLWTASAVLAEEVLRTMTLNAWKIAPATLLVAACLAAVAVARPQSGPPAPSQAPPEEAAAKAIPTPAPRPQPEEFTLRGVVRDAAGRPAAKAWVGSELRTMMDTWENPPKDQIRAAAGPYRDAKGEAVPPGELGRYFETRDGQGRWTMVHPDDIMATSPPQTFGGDGRAYLKDEYAAKRSGYTVRVARGGWWMVDLSGSGNSTRTDAEGRFRIDGVRSASRLHVASADYAQQAIHILRPEDLDRPIEIALRPAPAVGARVVETPRDDPKAMLNWAVYPVDEAGQVKELWLRGVIPKHNSHDPAHVKRHWEARLPAGRYRLHLTSDAVERLVDFDVPADAPLELPEIRVETLAGARMVGTPAAEIDAVDLDGKAARLADYRGKVVVLVFWGTWSGECTQAMPFLDAIRKRFEGRPLEFLAIHDASEPTPEAYRRAAALFLGQSFGGADLPFRVLLDRPSPTRATRPVVDGYGLPLADVRDARGSGRTADAYGIVAWPSIFLVAEDGTLAGRYHPYNIEGALEGRLGLPRSKPGPWQPTPPSGPIVAKGKVVDPEGRPVAGASLHPQMVRVLEPEDIITGADGGYSFTVEGLTLPFAVRVEPPDLAPRIATFDAAGAGPQPITLGVGVDVSGRVVRDGKPVAGVAVRLAQSETPMDKYLGFPETRTDDRGRFRFPHAFPGEELNVAPLVANFPDFAARIKTFRAGGDGTAVDLGDFEVRPGRRIAGRVVFADGKAIPPGTRVAAFAEYAGSRGSPVDDRGRFEVRGLPEGLVSVYVNFVGIEPRWIPPGYRYSPKNKGLTPLGFNSIDGRLDRDVDDLTILLEPGDPPPNTLDPGLLADFAEAKAATVEGVPPGSVQAAPR